MNGDKKRGEDILGLLADFDPEPLIDTVWPLYQAAFNNRSNSREAISPCVTALQILEKMSPETLPNPDVLADAKGRFHLLLASIYLNQGTELRKAKEHYTHSRDAYHSMQWSHLESLAYLGLAITLRKLERLKEASHKCENADDSIKPSKVYHEVSPEALESLREAIAQERARIQELLDSEEKPPPAGEHPTSPDKLTKSLKVFDIALGKKIIEYEQPTTELKPLSLKDYEEYAVKKDFHNENFDLTYFPDAKDIKYVLEIGKKIKVTSSGGLQEGDLIFIKEITSLGKLNGLEVAILVITRHDIVCVTRKRFFKYEDHYFLKEVEPGDTPIIVASYHTKETIAKYYEEYKTFDIKYVYDIAISGAVVAVRPRSEI